MCRFSEDHRDYLKILFLYDNLFCNVRNCIDFREFNLRRRLKQRGTDESGLPLPPTPRQLDRVSRGEGMGQEGRNDDRVSGRIDEDGKFIDRLGWEDRLKSLRFDCRHWNTIEGRPKQQGLSIIR